MPNWCYNRVYMKDLNKKDVFDKEEKFDFNKLIPLPDELYDAKHLAGSPEEMWYYVARLILSSSDTIDFAFHSEFLDSLKRLVEQVEQNVEAGKYKDLLPIEQEDGKVKYESRFLTKNDVFKAGKKLFNNVQKYGYTDWYDWSIANWGTKWNANPDYQELEDGECYFETAWSPPIPVISKLSKLNPDDEITHFFLDEACNFAGYAKYLNGEVTECHDYNPSNGYVDCIYYAAEVGNPLIDLNNEDEYGKSTAPAFLTPAFGYQEG